MEAAKNKLVRASAVISVFALLMYSSVSSEPIMMANPPVTKRKNPFFITYPKNSQCGTLLNTGNWTSEPIPIVEECLPTSQYASCSLEAIRRWKWGPLATKCNVNLVQPAHARRLLAGRWFACVGDSIARNICAGLMRAVEAPPSAFLFDRHSDFEQIIPTQPNTKTKPQTTEDESTIKITFSWRPFPQNATDKFVYWKDNKKPAFIVVATTLWPMLHEQNVDGYQANIAAMAAAATDMIPTQLPETPRPMMVMSTGTEIHAEKLQSTAKRVAMTPVAVDTYNRAIQDAKVFLPNGPFGILDLFSMTYGCGIECSVDGVHSRAEVYDAAAQILLNIFQQCDGKGEACWVTS